MTRTAIGLFENATVAGEVVSDLAAKGFPSSGVRTLRRPEEFIVTDSMSTPRTDFEVGLGRELESFGATAREARAYVEGVGRGGTIVFATGGDAAVNEAAEVMNRRGAIEIEEFIGRDVAMGMSNGETQVPSSYSDSPQTGRVRQPGGGARLFVW
jgi:hypothetical protein